MLNEMLHILLHTPTDPWMLNEYSATSDWRLGIILEARDTILDALILPLVTANVIAEYAVPAVVVGVHTTARVGEEEEPMVLERFAVQPGNSMEEVNVYIQRLVDAPFANLVSPVVTGVHGGRMHDLRFNGLLGFRFCMMYTIMIGNTLFPFELLAGIQVQSLLRDLGVGWNQIQRGDLKLDVALVRLRVHVVDGHLDGYHRMIAFGAPVINSALNRAGWLPLPISGCVHDDTQQAPLPFLHQPHRLTLQAAQEEHAEQYKDMPELE